jgi:hypothetical protein
VLKLELDQTWSGHEYLPGPLHAYGSARAGIRVNAAHDDSDATLRALNDTLEPYPVTAAAWVWQGSTPLVNGTSIAWVARTKDEAGKSLIPVASLASWYDNEPFLRPRLGSDNSVPSPLITWWDILLALSSLARYEPVI